MYGSVRRHRSLEPPNNEKGLVHTTELYLSFLLKVPVLLAPVSDRKRQSAVNFSFLFESWRVEHVWSLGERT